ncbi:MAG TPA: hypothetical protein EYP20_06045 [Aigarchaeota archaeon]|nr:hypothetical protein [Aigarchaeota archaeon]
MAGLSYARLNEELNMVLNDVHGLLFNRIVSFGFQRVLETLRGFCTPTFRGYVVFREGLGYGDALEAVRKAVEVRRYLEELEYPRMRVWVESRSFRDDLSRLYEKNNKLFYIIYETSGDTQLRSVMERTLAEGLVGRWRAFKQLGINPTELRIESYNKYGSWFTLKLEKQDRRFTVVRERNRWEVNGI